MYQKIRSFISMPYETKMFALNVVVYALLLGLSTIYCYARLDYVRSYAKAPSSIVE